MPIVNYKERALKDELRLFKNNKISEENKELLRDFLTTYDVSPARKSIFLRHIIKPLEQFKDISTLLDENIKDKKSTRKSVNTFFKELKDQLSPAYYGTIISVFNRFLSWLNEGDKPYACKDLKCNKKGMKRDLSPSDMITEEERDLLIQHARTTQIKAIISTMLDGGFRPSEFIDLNYGDITPLDEGFITALVKAGKTGGRDVPLYRCVPHLQAWLEQHPTKNPRDPLWVVEIVKKSHKKVPGETIPRYTIAGIRRRIESIAKKLGINKPFDFYNLRHSACTISKLLNDPADWSAKKYGHSLNFYTDTYGRLAGSDMVKRYKNHLKDIDDSKHNVACKVCNTVNTPNDKYCVKCANPLTIEEALKYKQRLENQDKKIEELQQALYQLTKQLVNKDLNM